MKPFQRIRLYFALLPLAFALLACGTSTIDNINQQGAEVAEWLTVPPRIKAATGRDLWAPKVGECKTKSCATAAESLPPPVIGLGSWKTGRALALRGLSRDKAEHVKAHEALHTLGVPHVTSKSLMNPSVRGGRDCISNAELEILCYLWGCDDPQPECTVEPGWQVLIPWDGDEYAVDPELLKKALSSGHDVWTEVRPYVEAAKPYLAE
ncbi:MAG: hypothetical protein R3337_00125 [Gammaproteobacteria bacterium]|nr:hypothetical protein [Gammaproteobacteria bacterium]